MTLRHDQVVLVDESGAATGLGGKEEVHRSGLRHLAFSVFLFRSGKLLLQQRAIQKYHSGGLWANSCCGHPFDGEPPLVGSVRRVKEELGVEVELEHGFELRYQASVGCGMVENEYVHVMLGRGPPLEEFRCDAHEIKDIRYAEFSEIKDNLNQSPSIYAEWFKIYMKSYTETFKRRAQELSL